MNPVDLRTLAASGPVHFMGIAGSGMCALAELLLRTGGQVSGCDVKDGPALRDLERLGAKIYVGHDPMHTEDASALVVTSAVPVDHPELLHARERALPVLKRAEALGAWVNRGKVVAVAGTHGKTTTTAMATEILAVAGMDPTGFVGGRVAGWGGNLRFGSDELYVVEADEYDRSFHTLRPHLAVVTNLEADHLDIYGDLEGVREGFRTFLRGLRSEGSAMVCGDDSGGSSLVAGLGRAAYTYGLSAGCQLRAVDVEVGHAATRCRVIEDGTDVGELALSLGGVHNLRNALGAAAAARHLGVDWPRIHEALASFRGVARRFERLGDVDGVSLVDDYAHHPTEIRATLAAARSTFERRRLVVAFQPHLYSRTRDFSAEFGAALSGADVVWITDVFPAREAAIPGVTGELIADAARSSGAADVRYHADLSGLDEAIAESLKDGDVVLTLGAGSIESLGPRILERLQEGIHA